MGNLVSAFALYCYGPSDKLRYVADQKEVQYPINPVTEVAFKQLLCFDRDKYMLRNLRLYHKDYEKYYRLPEAEGFNQKLKSKDVPFQLVVNKAPLLGSRAASKAMKYFCRPEKGFSTSASLARKALKKQRVLDCSLTYIQLASPHPALFMLSKSIASVSKDNDQKPVVKYLLSGRGVYKSKGSRIADGFLQTPVYRTGLNLYRTLKSVSSPRSMLKSAQRKIVGLGQSLISELAYGEKAVKDCSLSMLWDQSTTEREIDLLVSSRESIGLSSGLIRDGSTILVNLYGPTIGSHEYMFDSRVYKGAKLKDYDKSLYELIVEEKDLGRTKKGWRSWFTSKKIKLCPGKEKFLKSDRCSSSVLGKQVLDWTKLKARPKYGQKRNDNTGAIVYIIDE